MGINLITELPLWFSIFCVALGVGYAWLLYRKDIHAQFNSTQRKLLVIFRAVLVSFLAFLLLGPMLRTYKRQVEKPVIVVALDASASLINSRDSSAIKTEIGKSLASLTNKLGNDFDVRLYSFGDHAREGLDTSFQDKLTDFSELFATLDVNFANRNVGAVVIASDGLYNRGESPVYGPSRVKVPVYTIALGDTTIRKDLAISRVNHNRVAFLGNSFPIEVVLDAKQCAGAQVMLRILEDSVDVFSKAITIAGNRFHADIPVFLDAKKKGIRHYKIQVSVLEGEVTAVNNTRDIYIEIVENKQKILVIAAAPHPDLSALKNAIESSPNYEVVVNPDGQWDGRLKDYNLIIFHNIPSSSGNGNNAIKLAEVNAIPAWYILGASTAIESFNELKTGLAIQSPQPLKINDVQAITDAGFTLFTLSENLAKDISSWPPLQSPFGVYTVNGSMASLLYQKIGNVSSRQPLFYFAAQQQQKYAVLTGEGLWRWKLVDYSSNGNDENFREVISKTVQYLVARENNSPFKVFTESSFGENEALVFDAQLINPAGQPVNEPEARLVILSRDGKKFPYTFSRTDKNYTLNAGQFPSGRYSFTAEVKLGEQLYRQQGEFSVNALQVENASTVADHQVLFALSDRTGGRLFNPEAVLQLADSIRAREDVKPVSFQEKKLSELINLPWVFFLLVILLSTEWFIRKRSGSY